MFVYLFFFDSGKIEEYGLIIDQEHEYMSISSNDLDKDENNEKKKYENENLHSNLDEKQSSCVIDKKGEEKTGNNGNNDELKNIINIDNKAEKYEKEEKWNEDTHGNSDGKQSSLPLPKIIIGVIDLLLLAATAITFLLFFLTNFISSIVAPIVLTILFVVFTILFFRGDSLLPKSRLGKIDLGTGFFVKNQDRDEDKYKREGINLTLKRQNQINLGL